MKKIYFLFFMSLLPLIASAYSYEIDGIRYNLNSTDKTAEVTYVMYQTVYFGDVIIPSEVTYQDVTYSVTKIGYNAFGGCVNLTSVTIPNSVTIIGTAAFYRCSGLTSITIPNSVTTIEGDAFSQCSGLTSITIPSSVTTIESSAFAYCSGLSSISVSNENPVYDSREGCNAIIKTSDNELIAGCKNTKIPDGVTSIMKYAFSGCSDMTSLTLPNSVKSIGDMAFVGCKGLTTLTLPVSVKSLGVDAFASCSGLTSVTTFSSISLSTYSFNNCDNIVEVVFDCDTVKRMGIESSALENVKMTEKVKAIGNKAFYECSEITSISIPNSVKSIGEWAFYACSGLTSITIPSSVTTIGLSAFNLCSGLTSVKYYCSPSSIGNYVFYKCDNIKEIEFDCETVPNLFSENTNLETVILSDQVKTISGAFRGCSSLANVVMGESVNTIGDHAFDGCSSLTSITIPESVTSIGFYSFNKCSGLTSITIPSTVTSIQSYAFQGCSGLISINIQSKINTSVFTDCDKIKEVVYDYETIPTELFKGYKSIEKLTLGENVTTIEAYAFSGCTGLTSLTIPNNVTTISKYAFSECTGLTSVSLGSGLSTLEYLAFANCTSLASVTIQCSPSYINKVFSGCDKIKELVFDCETVKPIFSGISTVEEVVLKENVKSLDNNAFSGFSSLASITIPETVTSIGDGAFQECSSLTSITLPSGVTAIGDYTFSGCSSLTSFDIHHQITTIGYNAFEGCSGLTSITIPNSVTTLRSLAFKDCTGLTSVNMHSSVSLESWYNSPFYGCSNIKEVMIDCETVTPLFKGLASLEKITLKNSVTNIESSAFSDCSGLLSVVIPNSVTSIGSSAFSGCKGLTSITIGSGVTSIGSSAFSNTNLKKIIWLTNTPPTGYTNVGGTINYVANDQYTSFKNTIVYKFLSSVFEVDGVKYVPVSLSDRTCDAIDCVYDETAAQTKLASTVSYKGVSMTVKKILPYLVYNNSNIEELTVDFDGELAEYDFANCANMKSATLGDKIKAIGSYAFYKCPELQTVKLGSGTVSQYAFAECQKLQTVTLGNKVGEVSEYAFNNCTALESIVIPHSVTSIAKYSFYGCTAMASVTIGNGVTSIGESAFSGCTAMTSVTIGNGVTSIGERAFYGCTSLAKVAMGNCSGIIRNGAFRDCSSLSDLTIGTQVSEIKESAFQNCKSLTIVTIPESVKTIGNYVFSGCEGMTRLVISDRTEELALGSNGSNPLFSSCPLDSVYIGGNISYNTTRQYGYSPFYRNTSLRAVKITDKETEISENEFYGCTNLQRVIIGDGVTSIGNWAFSGCSSLKFFTFGSEVKTIGQETFSDCTALTEITSRAINPPTCGSQALDDISKWECKLYVPRGYLAAYQAADQWKEFLFAEEGDLSEIIQISAAKQTTYCSDKNLDFTSKPELKAYVATGYDKTTGTIWLTRVKDVPANTGFLLMGDAGDYEVPVKEGGSDSYYKNLFKGTLSGMTLQTTDGGNTNYYLSNGTYGVGFYKVTQAGGVALGSNRAYLSVPTEIPAVGSEGGTETIKVSAAGQVPYYTSQSLDFTTMDEKGVKAYTATGYDYGTGTIWLSRVKKVPAGTGILVMAPQGDYAVPTASVASVYDNMFKGSVTASTIYMTESIDDMVCTNYYLSNGTYGVGFYKVTKEGGVSLGANRCYLPIPNRSAGTRGIEADAAKFSAQNSAEVIGIRIFPNGTTGIHAIENGQSTMKDDAYYTLQGQRVMNPGKGLYIKNGKKVLIK